MTSHLGSHTPSESYYCKERTEETPWPGRYLESKGITIFVLRPITLSLSLEEALFGCSDCLNHGVEVKDAARVQKAYITGLFEGSVFCGRLHKNRSSHRSAPTRLIRAECGLASKSPSSGLLISGTPILRHT